jgi:hypothetical protein
MNFLALLPSRLLNIASTLGITCNEIYCTLSTTEVIVISKPAPAASTRVAVSGNLALNSTLGSLGATSSLTAPPHRWLPSWVKV